MPEEFTTTPLKNEAPKNEGNAKEQLVAKIGQHLTPDVIADTEEIIELLNAEMYIGQSEIETSEKIREGQRKMQDFFRKNKERFTELLQDLLVIDDIASFAQEKKFPVNQNFHSDRDQDPELFMQDDEKRRIALKIFTEIKSDFDSELKKSKPSDSGDFEEKFATRLSFIATKWAKMKENEKKAWLKGELLEQEKDINSAAWRPFLTPNHIRIAYEDRVVD